MKKCDGISIYAHYNNFKIAREEGCSVWNHTLVMQARMRWSEDGRFPTYDRDNDKYSGNWYNSCIDSLTHRDFLTITNS